MSELSQVLDKVRAEIAKLKGKNLSEENTKAALINPVLCALGWHVGNLDEVSQEFRLESSNNPVDYALLLGGSPTVLVEAKALGQSLAGGKWADQIMGYAGTAGVTWVVLTNGDEYRIYNATVPVPFEEKLFRTVRLSDAASPTEGTLALLSKERIDDIGAKWQAHFADKQVHAAINKLFSSAPDSLSLLVSFVKKHVKGLGPKEIRASLGRLRASFEFPVDSTESIDRPEPASLPPTVGDYIKLWEPIRTESNGLFAGKPADGSRISKYIRGICLSLGVNNHASHVELSFDSENRRERRDRVLKLLPAGKYPRELHESPKCVSARFHVLDKGIKDRDNWPQIREKLKALGEQIYKVLKESDV